MAPRIDSSDESDGDVPLGALNGATQKLTVNGVDTPNGNGKRTLSPSAAANGASKPAVRTLFLLIHYTILVMFSWHLC